MRHTRLFITAASVLAITAGLLATPGVASGVAYATDGFYPAAGLPGGGGFCITPGGTAPAGTYGGSGTEDNGAEATVMAIAMQYGVVVPYTPSGSQIVYEGVPAATGGTGFDGAILNPQDDTITAEQIANDMTLGVDDTDHSDSDSGLVDGIYNFAREYPGPWYLKAGGNPGPYTEGDTYTATVTVAIAATGKAVDVGNLPVSVTASSGASVTGTGHTNADGVASFNFTPTASSWSFSVSSPDMAGGTVTEYRNVADPSGYQTLTAPTQTPASTRFYGTAHITPQQTFGNLTIRKTDAATGAGLAGAVFDVTGPTYPNGDSVTTGSNGDTKMLVHLTLGDYTITETRAPPGFRLANPDTQTVDLTTADTTATVSFADAPITGGLSISKTDATGGGGLAGAVFSVTGPSYPSGTSVTTPASGTVTLSGLTLGDYTVTETAAPTGFQLANPASQTVDVASSATVPVTFSDSPQPATISTTISSTALTVGDTLSDSITVGGIASNGGVADTSASWTLLGPVPMADGACAGANFSGAPTAASGTISVPGDGTYSTGASPPVATAGCYGYAETVQPNAWTSGTSSAPNASDEQAAVAPTITTQASSSGPTVGSTISDSVTIAGLGGTPAKVAWKVLGPVSSHTGSCAGLDWTGAPVAATGSYRPVDGTTTTGTGTTAPVITTAGCYGYSDLLTSTGGYFTPITTNPSAVEAEYFAPTITTQAAESGPNVGSTMTDTATVAGLPASGGTITWTVYGPVAAPAGSCANASWTGAPRFTSGTTGVSADGPVVLGPTPKIQIAGCYAFSDTLSSTNGAFAPVAASPSPTEAVYFAPTISTHALPSGPSVGSTMTDSATVAGLPTSGGTVSWTLLGPIAPKAAPASDTVNTGVPNASTCAGLNWTGAPTAATGTAKATADGQVTLGPTKIRVAGCYGYSDTLSSSTGAFLPVAAPITTSETAYLMPTLTTQAAASAHSAGSDLTDTATIAGLTTPATISWTVLGPIPPSHTGSCADLDWSSAPTAAHGTQLAVDGANTLSTAALPDAGCYGWVDTLTAATPVQPFLPLTVGITTPETAYFTPSLTTKAVSTPVNGDGPSVPGSATLTDQVTLTGVDPATTRISWTVYGPVSGEACTAVNWRAAPVFANGSEQVPGETFTITVPKPVVENGCYSWADTVTSTNRTFSSLVVPAGLVAETVAGSIGSAGAAAPGLVNSGHPGPPVRGNWWWIGTGITVIALGIGLAVVAVTDRKRNKIA